MQLSANIAALGTESAFEVLARAQALAARGRSVINLGIGQPDFPTPPHIVEAACRALVDGHHGYTPACGIPELREAIVGDVASRLGARVDPGQVVVVPGGKVTMAFAMLMFGSPGAQARLAADLPEHPRVAAGGPPRRAPTPASPACRRRSRPS